MLRKLLAGSAATLGLFHVWLFAGQVLAGELTDPARVLRWLVAIALAAALAALSRRGLSLFRSRQAIAVWVLAALLHAPAVGQRLDGVTEPVPSDVAFALTRIVAAAAVALTIWLIAVAFGAVAAPTRHFSTAPFAVPVLRGPVLLLAVRGPRPPPASPALLVP